MFKNLGINIKKILDETKESGVDLNNTEEMREYLTNRLTERKDELKFELSEAEKEIDSSEAKRKAEDVYYDLQYNLHIVTKRLEEIDTQLEKMSILLQNFERGSFEAITYNAEMEELISGLPLLKEVLELENGTLSSKSVENLIRRIDELKNEQAIRHDKKNEEAQKLIEQYEELCEQYKDDEEGLEDALWEEGIEVEEVEAAKQSISKIDPEITKLIELQETLRKHQETGVKLSSELERALNDSVKMWKNQVDSPCQVISESSVKTIASKINIAIPGLTKERQGLPEEQESFSKQLKEAEEELMKIQEFSEFYSQNASAYMVVGLPPHHQVSLPLAVNGKRGLHPEAMLKKMHELVAGEEKQEFNLHTNNCSLTSIEVLSAGAEHDSLLHSMMDERALGFFGTPQQVLENARSFRKAIDNESKGNVFKSIFNASPLDRALGYAMSLYMDPSATKAKQNAGLALAVVVGVAKIPGIIIGSLSNPKKGFNDILNTLNLVYSRNSTGFKVGLTLMALPAMLVLAPLAAVQKGMEVIGNVIAKPFKMIAGLFSQKPQITDEITVPVGSQQLSEKVEGCSNGVLASLLNSHIKSKIDANTLTVALQKSPEETIREFESKLAENPESVVVLSEKAHHETLKFISKSDDESLKQRFYDCCSQSVSRSQKFAPKTRNEIDEILEKETTANQTESSAKPPQKTTLDDTVESNESSNDSGQQIEREDGNAMRIS